MTNHTLPPLPYPISSWNDNPYSSVDMEKYGQACADAARKAAIEECAKVAHSISDKYAFGYYGQEVDTADEIEAAILELLK